MCFDPKTNCNHLSVLQLPEIPRGANWGAEFQTSPPDWFSEIETVLSSKRYSEKLNVIFSVCWPINKIFLELGLACLPPGFNCVTRWLGRCVVCGNAVLILSVFN